MAPLDPIAVVIGQKRDGLRSRDIDGHDVLPRRGAINGLSKRGFKPGAKWHLMIQPLLEPHACVKSKFEAVVRRQCRTPAEQRAGPREHGVFSVVWCRVGGRGEVANWSSRPVTMP